MALTAVGQYASIRPTGWRPARRASSETRGRRKMTEGCYRCGSANVRAISMEMAFAPLEAEPVYALATPVVCLACGMVGGFLLLEGPLGKLRDGVRVQAADAAGSGPGPNNVIT